MKSTQESKFNTGTLLISSLLVLLLITNCQSNLYQTISISLTPDFQPPTPFLPAVTPTPTITGIPQQLPSPPTLPVELSELKVDSRTSYAEFDLAMNAWVWRDKKGVIRRVLDPLSGHLLARTSIANDRLTYEIDSFLKWEVNLVNYQYYPTHAPLGTAYINMLKLKYPEVFAQANDQSGIIFRILQIDVNELPSPIKPVTLMDEGTEKERFFLKPSYLPASNEFLFVMGLKTDFLTRKGAINTYTEDMLNYCISPNEQGNPSGPWGIEVYKHAIK